MLDGSPPNAQVDFELIFLLSCLNLLIHLKKSRLTDVERQPKYI